MEFNRRGGERREEESDSILACTCFVAFSCRYYPLAAGHYDYGRETAAGLDLYA